MSKQLAISAALSVLAMSAFTLLATPNHADLAGTTATGAKTQVSAPALDRLVAALPFIGE